MDIVLVDDHPAVRAGLRGLIEDEDGMRVVASAASAREGFEAIADTQPAVALVDLHLPDDDGLSLCLRTRTLPTPPRVIIYSAFADIGLAVRAAIAGAEGVLPKATAPQLLLDALRDGAPSNLDARALRAVGERIDPGDLPILGMLAHGVGARELEMTLGLEPAWLEARRWAMLARLGGNSRRHPSPPPDLATLRQ